ncbi:hypothetical protein F7725_017733 [Dissostichus mawsoni]|uniref:Uncharacterized protein n=1 Tax=Dissostichus mawsoni TaxID=36200 RepID=A0A7J5XPF6_DISMA|nr:hypothetical protein F7725_017733 [Dissostichus mawsoni]
MTPPSSSSSSSSFGCEVVCLKVVSLKVVSLKVVSLKVVSQQVFPHQAGSAEAAAAQRALVLAEGACCGEVLPADGAAAALAVLPLVLFERRPGRVGFGAERAAERPLSGVRALVLQEVPAAEEAAAAGGAAFDPGRSWCAPPPPAPRCAPAGCVPPRDEHHHLLPVGQRTRAHFLLAELGFLGFRIMVFRTTAFSWGRPNMAPTCWGGDLGFP